MRELVTWLRDYAGEAIGTRAILDQVERNDDERTVALAELAHEHGAFGYAFFDD